MELAVFCRVVWEEEGAVVTVGTSELPRVGSAAAAKAFEVLIKNGPSCSRPRFSQKRAGSLGGRLLPGRQQACFSVAGRFPMGLNTGCSPPLHATHSLSHDHRKNWGAPEACSWSWWLQTRSHRQGGFCCLSYLLADCNMQATTDFSFHRSDNERERAEGRHRKPVQGHVCGEVRARQATRGVDFVLEESWEQAAVHLVLG